MNGEDIVDIQDITPFVNEQYKFGNFRPFLQLLTQQLVEAKAWDMLQTAKEEIYEVEDPEIRKQVKLSESKDSETTE